MYRKFLKHLSLLSSFLLMLNACSLPNKEPGIMTPLPVNVEVLPTASKIEFEVLPEISTDYLVNPGIGWQFGPDPNGVNIPETVAYSIRREIGWSILNPAEGIYDWEALDAQLSDAVQSGKQFSFRVYTMIGEPFGGHMVPDWVIQKDNMLLPTGEPDYSNCSYQEEWSKFVEQLIIRYDGNPNIAFIDISGYGDFNEWSWQSVQTTWDDKWADTYPVGQGSAEDFQTLDGQARRRLVDMFIGGDYSSHNCHQSDGTVLSMPYSYKGFQKTQLVMPYAGIAQSTQYVVSRRSDVGFRFDCLGNPEMDFYQKIGDEILKIWKNAPIVYELCSPFRVDLENAREVLRKTHGSMIHDNGSTESYYDLLSLAGEAGYKYFLSSAKVGMENRRLIVQMNWINIGLAPNYPGMGQDFALKLYLEDEVGEKKIYLPVNTDISNWLPAGSGETPLQNEVDVSFDIPENTDSGNYVLKTSIIDLRTEKHILLAINDTNNDGSFTIGRLYLP